MCFIFNICVIQEFSFKSVLMPDCMMENQLFRHNKCVVNIISMLYN